MKLESPEKQQLTTDDYAAGKYISAPPVLHGCSSLRQMRSTVDLRFPSIMPSQGPYGRFLNTAHVGLSPWLIRHDRRDHRSLLMVPHPHVSSVEFPNDFSPVPISLSSQQQRTILPSHSAVTGRKRTSSIPRDVHRFGLPDWIPRVSSSRISIQYLFSPPILHVCLPRRMRMSYTTQVLLMIGLPALLFHVIGHTSKSETHN